MEITLGDKIKINGEEVPEYLLKALYENLKVRFDPNSKIASSDFEHKIKPSYVITSVHHSMRIPIR